ncbi:MAG: thermonuclease family protein [Nitrosomonadales bacterium]|nr:thermonuclease family protein [Nitrosomonadales bacterium]
MNGLAVKLICAALLCMSLLAHAEALRPSSGQALRQSSGQAFTAKVIEVLDGDTVLIKRTNGLLKVRLAEIDAPEKSQLFGAASQQSLAAMVMGKQVKFVSQTMDQYGRMVAHLSVDGLDVNSEQIRRGMAWEYSNYHSNKALIALQNEAKLEPRGLWAQSNPTPPWEWRKLHPSVAPSGASSATASTSPGNPGCGNKKRCAEMSSCEEAKFYLSQCGVKSLDGDVDGTPCESLCASPKK